MWPRNPRVTWREDFARSLQPLFRGAKGGTRVRSGGIRVSGMGR